MVPGLYRLGAVVAAVLLAGVVALLRADLRRSVVLRFWALGTSLCALPLGSTPPTDRQLLLIGFGVFGFAAPAGDGEPDAGALSGGEKCRDEPR